MMQMMAEDGMQTASHLPLLVLPWYNFFGGNLLLVCRYIFRDFRENSPDENLNKCNLTLMLHPRSFKHVLSIVLIKFCPNFFVTRFIND